MKRGLYHLIAAVVLASIGLEAAPAWAITYEVGPGRPLASLAGVPWESLNAGDTVLVYWQATPYNEKFVIGRVGTAANPITVSGVPDPVSGALPMIDGAGATTPTVLDYWNEERGIIKIGGTSTPPDSLPAYIVVENLDIFGARGGFTNDGGNGSTYNDNASAIYIEKGEHITIRNCVFHDSGNGLFIANATSDVVVEYNYLYDNGNVGSAFEHNSYTEANGILFQFNRYGPLCAGCDGNNLKDRSAGTVIRYNWIEGGNRQLDLVDSSVLSSEPSYATTFVYGNILIEPDGAGNSQIVHYGGDGSPADYRGGTLYFFNNTVISTRSGNTTLFRLSTNGESAECFNNVVYVTANGSNLAMLDADGNLTLRNNWFKASWSDSHSGLSGVINDMGGEVNGPDPGFVNFGNQDFHLDAASACIDAGAMLLGAVLPDHDLLSHYVVHRGSEPRPVMGALDLGAYESCPAGMCATVGTDAGVGPGDSGVGPGDSGTVPTDTAVPFSDSGTPPGADAAAGTDAGDGDGGGGCGCRTVTGADRSPPAVGLLLLALWLTSRGGRRGGRRPRTPPARAGR